MNTWFSNNVENDEIGTHDKQLITYTIDNDDNVSDTVQDLSYVEGEGDSTATTIGCNHGKVDQKKTPAPYNQSFFLGQMPKSSSKMLFELNIFIMMILML